MSAPFRMPVYVGSGVKDAYPVLAEHATSLEDLAGVFRAASGRPKGEWYWLAVDLSDGHRVASSVSRVYSLVIDIDDGMTLDDARERVQSLGYPCVLYTSANHQKVKDDKPPCDRFRMVFPLASPVTGDAWVYIYGPLCDYVLGVPDAYDPACKDPSRLWYAPQNSDHVEILCSSGDLLHPGIVKPLPKQSPVPPKTETSRKRRSGAASREKPGEDYEASVVWSDLLEGIGCRFLREKGGVEYYQRAGKTGDEPSCTVNSKGSGLLHVFSSSMAPLVADENYSKFAFYTLHRFGSLSEQSFKDAAKELSEDGFGSQEAYVPCREYVPHPADTEYPNGHYPDAEDQPARVKFEPTDLGNAERFVRLYGQDLRYCHLWGRWLFWDSRRWVTDDTGGAVATQKAIEMIRGIATDAFLPENHKEMGSMLEWSGKCHSKARIDSLISLAKHLPGIPVTPKDLDTDTELLNLANGILDLRTFRMIPHDRKMLITKIINIPYVEDANCPHWSTFVSEVLQEDIDLISYIQKAVGYSLTGLTSEKCFFFLHGNGNNGKTVFVEAIGALMSDYGTQVGVETLMVQQKQAQTNDIAALKGARFVSSTETENGKRLAEATVKRLTGGDTITCRFLNQEFFSYRPHFKIWMSGNHKPTIRNNDEGMWTRVALIPFEASIPKEKRIPAETLSARFKAESAGMLAWAVNGCKAWRKDGLVKPEAVVIAVDDYRTESDAFGEFLDDATMIDAFGTIRAKDYYAAFCRWAKLSGEKNIMTSTRFGKTLRERGEKSIRDRDGIFYEGRALKEEPQQHSYHWKD